MKTLLKACVLISSLALGACSSSNDPPPPTYTVGGMVSGLTGTGLVLQLNGGSDLTVDMDGAFTFTTALGSGVAYDVTVLSSPAGETCTVSAGDGTIGSANVTDVIVTCSTSTFTVGGTVTGIVDGDLTLSLNGDEDLVIMADGAFTFLTAVADGSPYEVTIVSPPANTDCTITNDTGTIAGANVTDVQVDCVRTYAIGGRVFGATAGFELDLNGTEKLFFPMGGADQPFTFTTRLPDAAAYTVTVSIEPDAQACTVKDGVGNVASADVTGIEVYCVGLASDLYAAETSPASIYNKVNLLDGTVQPLTQNIGFDSVGGLAYNEGTSLLYGLDSATDTLLAINVLTGAPATIGSTGSVGIADVNGLAYDDSGSVLYGIASASGSTTGQLLTIDTTTGVGTAVGAGFATGGGNCLGLAFDAANDVLYASTSDGSLITVDPATGASTGSVTVSVGVSLDGLGFDQTGMTLYGTLNGQDVVTIDVGTGTPTAAGTIDGFQSVDGLTYAGDFDDLFGMDTSLAAANVLLSIEAADASAETVGSMGWPLTGMGQDPTNGLAYGITVDSHLVEIDQDTGLTRYIAQLAIPGGQETQCLAYNDDTMTLFTFGIDPAGDDRLLEFGIDGSLTTDHGIVAVDGGDWAGLTFAISGADRRMFGVYQPATLSEAAVYEVGATGTVVLQYALNGLVQVGAIAHVQDSAPGRFFGMDTSNDRLVQIDVITGVVTVIGPTPKSFGMIWVP